MSLGGRVIDNKYVPAGHKGMNLIAAGRQEKTDGQTQKKAQEAGGGNNSRTVRSRLSFAKGLVR
jgi:hypothetical protein